MKWLETADYHGLSRAAASVLLASLEANPRLVIGLPTGRTPEGMYSRIVQECSLSYRCFRDVVTFNLDEYVGLRRDHPGSYASYMRKHLFDHVDIDPANVHIPDGLAERFRVTEPGQLFDEALGRECESYEAAIENAGGIDLMFLGLGMNGHIGFNEPGAALTSRTRVIRLSESTRKANAALFPDGDVPQRAITMGIATILAAKKIVVLASGAAKQEAVSRLAVDVDDIQFPASALHRHDDVTVIVDLAARPIPEEIVIDLE
ncbi:MAG TPA: glucosamine-6-phosphate deaminase [Thermoanaerobaculia bacterium]|nr:glucosamine-6-phosphate deaminase [Thermoanaerobaculia bacterium]